MATSELNYKTPFRILNSIISCIGIGLIVCGSVVQDILESIGFNELLKIQPTVTACIVLSIITGSILFLSGILGYVLYAKNNVRALVCHFILVSLMILPPLVTLISAHMEIPAMEVTIRESMKRVYLVWMDPTLSSPAFKLGFTNYTAALKKPNEIEVDRTAEWISLQKKFSCCGYDSIKDWRNIRGVPAYAAYCTESVTDSALDIYEMYAGDGTTDQEFKRKQDHLLELTSKMTFDKTCRPIFTELVWYVTGVVIALLLVLLNVLNLYLLFIQKMRIQQKEDKEREGISADTQTRETGIPSMGEDTVAMLGMSLSEIVVAVESNTVTEVIPDMFDSFAAEESGSIFAAGELPVAAEESVVSMPAVSKVESQGRSVSRSVSRSAVEVSAAVAEESYGRSAGRSVGRSVSRSAVEVPAAVAEEESRGRSTGRSVSRSTVEGPAAVAEEESRGRSTGRSVSRSSVEGPAAVAEEESRGRSTGRSVSRSSVEVPAAAEAEEEGDE